MQRHDVEVIVIGGGPAGTVAALALASAGIETALVAAVPPQDNRTTALLMGSVAALETLGVWRHCCSQAAPLRGIRLIDATARLLRAPEVFFSAAEIGQEAFGHNVENNVLRAALAQCRAQARNLIAAEGRAIAITPAKDGIAVDLENGPRFHAKLVIGAEGRHSPSRLAAGIETERTTYPQTALTFNVAHARPHDDVSTEFHTESGPLTLVPLPGRRSSVVWVLNPADAERIADLSDTVLAAELERRCHSIMGRLTAEPGRGVFALAMERARHFAANRVALVGESAHVIPPIGAQGLNLGLRDAATIAELVVNARRVGGDPGSAELLADYDRQRRADVATRTFAVDWLNRSLLSDFLPLHGARGFALYLAEQIAPVRRALMREGMFASARAPRLMRGEAL